MNKRAEQQNHASGGRLGTLRGSGSLGKSAHGNARNRTIERDGRGLANLYEVRYIDARLLHDDGKTALAAHQLPGVHSRHEVCRESGWYEPAPSKFSSRAQASLSETQIIWRMSRVQARRRQLR